MTDIGGNPRPIGGRGGIVAFESKCGDGKVDEFEECDDGNHNENNICVRCMVIRYCEDGIVNNKETCDDGNLVSGDGCSSFCRIEEGKSPDDNSNPGSGYSLSHNDVAIRTLLMKEFGFAVLILVSWRMGKLAQRFRS